MSEKRDEKSTASAGAKGGAPRSSALPESSQNEGAARLPREPGRFAYDGLERLLHERARLSILSSLASHAEGLLFNDLKSLCALTDGNLSRQLQTLQEAGMVEVWKGFKNNRPQTMCRLTSGGRERFLEYVGVLEGVVADAFAAGSKQAGPDSGARRRRGGLDIAPA